MPDLRAARRYASALFGVALRQGSLESVETDLRAVQSLWDDSPDLQAAMIRPQIPLDVRKRIWNRLLEGSAGDLARRFVELLVEKRRVDLLPAIGAEFQRLADEHRGIVRAQVTTAVPLAADQRDDLRAQLNRRTGKTVELIERVDPTILGGAVVRIGDQVLDGSLRTSLLNLRQRLAGTRY